MNDVQQSFHARILFLCHEVMDACSLTDIQTLKSRAKMIADEINGVPVVVDEPAMPQVLEDDCSDLI